MQSEPLESDQQSAQLSTTSIPSSPIQHGYHYHDSQDSPRAPSECSDDARGDAIANDAANLARLLHGLNLRANGEHAFVHGQRISEYENASLSNTPKKAFGFRVVKSATSDGVGPNILNFPNGW